MTIFASATAPADAVATAFAHAIAFAHAHANANANHTGSHMTAEELAQIDKWQSTSEGKADLAMHSLGITIDDLNEAACTREGFRLIRLSRVKLIEARNAIDRLIEATSLFHAEAAE